MDGGKRGQGEKVGITAGRKTGGKRRPKARVGGAGRRIPSHHNKDVRTGGDRGSRSSANNGPAERTRGGQKQGS